MTQWIISGIRTGIRTTSYPDAPDRGAGVTPGLPANGLFDTTSARALLDCCPTQVFAEADGGVTADARRCVHCYRCLRAVEHPANWEKTYEWARTCGEQNEFVPAFQKSIHVLVVDAGDCGACLNEVKQLNNPYYNMHRLGFFITPSPRHADVLLVVGPVTDHLRAALQKTYEAMPTPKRVVAVGACALTGGIFAESFVCSKGVSGVLPVDVEVPGNPPPPLAILHGLLVAVGRKKPLSPAPSPTATAGAAIS